MTIDEYRELVFKNKMIIDDFLNHQIIIIMDRASPLLSFYINQQSSASP